MLAVAAIILGIVLLRAITRPVDTYGDSGAGYIEHLERVRVLARLAVLAVVPARLLLLLLRLPTLTPRPRRRPCTHASPATAVV